MTNPRILLAYHTAEGQTARIAERIASVLSDGGATVDTVLAEDAPSPTEYDGVVLGDSIHMTRHSRALTRYITRYADELNRLPVALFQVSLTSATDDEEHAAKAHEFLQRLLDVTGLDPDQVGFFAGALAYTRYGWLKRRIMRSVAEKEGEDTDISVDHDYTDWKAVDHFATDALALVGVGSDRGFDRPTGRFPGPSSGGGVR